MNADLVGAVLSGVLGGRRKRSRNALSFLGRGGFITANTLLTAAGLAWGAYESWQVNNAAGTGASATPPSGGGVPPLPAVGGSVRDSGGHRASTVRLLRLAVAAANADGSMSESERMAIATEVKAAGAPEKLVTDLARPAVLADILAGVTDQVERTTLYVLAFTITRADEQVSGAERIFLAQVAHLLGLDPQVVAGLEKGVSERIDAAS